VATSGDELGVDGVEALAVPIVYTEFVYSGINGLPLQPSQPASLAHCINGN